MRVICSGISAPFYFPIFIYRSEWCLLKNPEPDPGAAYSVLQAERGAPGSLLCLLASMLSDEPGGGQVSELFDGWDYVERSGGVNQKMCSESAESAPEFQMNCTSVVLSLLRNDLKMYETMRAGAECSGAKLEKTTAMQVLLSHLFVRFQCSRRLPRARSTIATIYDSGSADQGECFQFMKQKCTGDREGEAEK